MLTETTPTTRARHARAETLPRWRMPWVPFVLALVALAGVMTALYPHIASWISQYNQSQLIVTAASEQRAHPFEALEAETTRAREYNRLLVGGALLEANAHKPRGEVEQESDGYYSLLNATDTGVMGRLRISSIGVDLPIYHGTDDYTLTLGVGHLRGTSLPVGGTSQHSVLTAHRGLPEATLFNDLNKVGVGDRFVIEVFGEVLTYEVRETRVVEPTEQDALRVSQGEDLVTLVTCTPLGINTHRILVTGERVTPTPVMDVQAAGERPEIPGFPWWALVTAGAVGTLTVFVWRLGKDEARRQATRAGEPQPQ